MYSFHHSVYSRALQKLLISNLLKHMILPVPLFFLNVTIGTYSVFTYSKYNFKETKCLFSSTGALMYVLHSFTRNVDQAADFK